MPAVLDPILHDGELDELDAAPPPVRAVPECSPCPVDRDRRAGTFGWALWLALLAAALAAFAVAARGRGYKTRLLQLVSRGEQTQFIQPSLISSRPVDGAAQVLPGAGTTIAAKLYLPNGALDAATLSSASVRLVRTSDGAPLPATITVTNGQILNVRPGVPLAPGTRYTVELTAGLKDARGIAMTPASFSFTTGRTADAAIEFEKVPLPATAGAGYTCVQMGPDGHLWAGSDDGRIFRFPVAPDGSLATPRLITSLQSGAGGKRLLTGFCFDPASSADRPVLWASHGHYGFENAPDLSGTLSRLSGPDLTRVEHVIVGLPRSVKDHLNNQPVFGPDGAIYFGQGSNNAYGAADPTWGDRGQRMLSATILRLDVDLLSGRALPLDVTTTDAGGTYDPSAAGAPLTIYAEGVRQAWDLAWHTNGRLYAPVNGSSAGGNTPAGAGAPALIAVPDAEHDWLLNVIHGRYYGHPNAVLGHFVLNGGNPTAAPDRFEIPQYPAGTAPDPAWDPPVYDFGNHVSANGIIEYQNRTACGGKLAGRLIVCRYNSGADLLALSVDANGGVSSAAVGIPGFGNLANPLDVTEDARNGNLYVSEYGAQRLSLLRPIAANERRAAR